MTELERLLREAIEKQKPRGITHSPSSSNTIMTRLIRTSDTFDLRAMPDRLTILMANIEDSLQLAGFLPGIDYKLCDLLAAATPMIADDYKNDRLDVVTSWPQTQDPITDAINTVHDQCPNGFSLQGLWEVLGAPADVWTAQSVKHRLRSMGFSAWANETTDGPLLYRKTGG